MVVIGCIIYRNLMIPTSIVIRQCKQVLFLFKREFLFLLMIQ